MKSLDGWLSKNIALIQNSSTFIYHNVLLRHNSRQFEIMNIAQLSIEFYADSRLIYVPEYASVCVCNFITGPFTGRSVTSVEPKWILLPRLMQMFRVKWNVRTDTRQTFACSPVLVFFVVFSSVYSYHSSFKLDTV